MPGRPWVLAETTWKTVRETSYEVAVLPWGATEAHNYHLPYGTDTIQAEGVAVEAARIAWEEGAKVVVLPPLALGVQAGQLDIPLCLHVNPSTQAAVLRDVARSLEGQGIPKLAILNGHGATSSGASSGSSSRPSISSSARWTGTPAWTRRPSSTGPGTTPGSSRPA